MRADHVDLLTQFINKADQWRAEGLAVDVEITQLNATFPSGGEVVLRWHAQAIDNGDDTFTGDWLVDTHGTGGTT